MDPEGMTVQNMNPIRGILMIIAGKNLLPGFPVVKNVRTVGNEDSNRESLKIVRDNLDEKKRKILKQNVRSTHTSR